MKDVSIQFSLRLVVLPSLPFADTLYERSTSHHLLLEYVSRETFSI